MVRFLRSVATSVTLDKLTVVKGGAKLPDHGAGPFLTIDQVAVLAVADEKTIELADHEQLRKESFELASGYMRQLAVAISKGGQEAMRFLNDLQRKKDAAVASTNRKFEEVKGYNDKRVDAFKLMLQGVATIKFESTVILKTAGMFAGPAGILIGLGYDVLVKAIKDANSSADADVVTVTIEAAEEEGGKTVKEEAQQHVAEKGTEMWHDYVTKLDEELSKLYRQVGENRLNTKKMRGVLKRLSRAEARATKVVGSPAAVTRRRQAESQR